MYYITFFDRFGRKHTSIKNELPHLRTTNTTHYNLQLPELTAENKTYYSFRIPKASGGYRTINAPTEALKSNQRLLVDYLQTKCNILESPWAYAYIKEHCAVDALKKHQENHSKWFLKLDLKDFFPSCKVEIVKTSLKKIYPICSWTSEEQNKFFSDLNENCYLDDALPQGAVTSPFLSNITLLPYDYAIHELLRKAETFKKQKYIYTRYADDILISAKTPFDFREIACKISQIFGDNFTIKTEKTRYGSSAGRNWNLGCMLNTENNITIGYKQKEQWKRKMMDVIIRYKNNEPIPTVEKQHLQGKLAYYKMIEPDYFNYLNGHYQHKYGVNFEEILKTRL